MMETILFKQISYIKDTVEKSILLGRHSIFLMPCLTDIYTNFPLLFLKFINCFVYDGSSHKCHNPIYTIHIGRPIQFT